MSSKQMKTFRGMSAVKADYEASGMTDTEFANSISDGTATGNYSCAEIRQYRQTLGIENNVGSKRVSSSDVKELRDCLQAVLSIQPLRISDELTARIHRALGVAA